MKFQYYITIRETGEIIGTNDLKIARDHSWCKDYCVLDVVNGKQIVDREPFTIRPIG